MAYTSSTPLPDSPVDDPTYSGRVLCTICVCWVPNTTTHRATHDAWHASTMVTAATGSAANTAAIGIGAQGDVVVTLNKTMPTATYAASPMLLAATPTLLGTVSVVGVVAQTTSTVTVRVKNNGLSILAPNAIGVGVMAIGQ